MKILLLILSFSFIIACGKTKGLGINQSSVGELRPLNGTQAITPAEITRLTAICQAMSRKASNLSSSLPGTPFVFNVTQTDCDNKNLSSNGDVSTLIRLNGTTLVFEGQGKTFPFPNIETPQSGILSSVCSSLSTLTNARLPVTKSAGEFLYVSTFQSNDCSPNVDELCVTLETAVQDGNFFQVQSSEWMKVNTNPLKPQYGFYTDRKLVTRGFCAVNKTSSTRATLK